MRRKQCVESVFYLVLMALISISGAWGQADKNLDDLNERVNRKRTAFNLSNDEASDLKAALNNVKGKTSADNQTALETGLKTFVEQNNLKLFDALLEDNSQIPAADANGKTALMYAAEAGNIAVVRQLITWKPDGKKWTCYYAAADLHEYINRCANFTDTTHGYNALMYASSKGRTEVVNYLLNAGANATLKCSFGQFTALQIAQNAGKADTAGVLEKKLEADKKSSDEPTIWWPIFESNSTVIGWALGFIGLGVVLFRRKDKAPFSLFVIILLFAGGIIHGSNGGSIGRILRFLRKTFSKKAIVGIVDPSREENRFLDTFGGDEKLDEKLVENFDHFQTGLDLIKNKLQPGTCVVLSGDAGVGKTSLTHRIAHFLRYEQGKKERHTFLIYADTPENLRWGLAQLATDKFFALDVYFPERITTDAQDTVSADSIKKAIDRVCKVLSDTGNWLLVFDNMDDYFHKDSRCKYEEVEKFFPSLENGGRILITTRDEAEAIAHCGLTFHSVERLTLQEGAQFLLRRIGREESPAELELAGKISENLSGLLLTLDQAAAYISARIYDEDTYTLQNYLSDYEQNGRELRAVRPHGSHDPIDVTVTMALSRLWDGDDSQKLVVSLLLTCAFFHPDKISRALLQDFRPDASSQPPTEEAIKTAITRAKKLRLLDTIDSENVRIHREVRDVLQDLLDPANREGTQNTGIQEKLEEPLRKGWQQLAMQAVENALSRDEFAPELLPHVHSLLNHKDIEAQLTRSSGAASSAETYPLLHKHLEQRKVLKDIQNGGQWENLLFGSETPSYEAMHRLQDTDEHKKLAARMAAIRHVCDEKFGRVVFTCVYLVAHYWWDAYLDGDYLAQPLLEQWGDDTQADKTLLGHLRDFQNHYPPVRNYKTHATKTEDWKKVATALREIRQQLGIEPLPDDAKSAHRFARAITNFYLADALSYTDELNVYHAYSEGQSLQLRQEAKTLLAENHDEFHRIWAICETANYYVENGQRCKSYAQQNSQESHHYHHKSQNHFAQARALCLEGLEAAIERAEEEEDDLDAEVIANFYALLADTVEAEENGTDHQNTTNEIAGYRCAAAYLAYAFVLHEADSYSVAFYDEQIERMMDCLTSCAPGEALARCRYVQRCWKRKQLNDDDLMALCSDAQKLRAVLFPAVPRLVGSVNDAELSAENETQIKRFISTMPRQIARLQLAHPLELTASGANTLVRVAELLINQLKDDEEEQDDE